MFAFIFIFAGIYCVNGDWSAQTPTCVQEFSACGLTTTRQQQLGGTSITHLQLPWHTVIYRKSSGYYKLSCGGSLITETKIISAANCFYDIKNKLRPASDFLVAVKKMYLLYDDTRDWNKQLSEVTDIKVPSSYRGHETHLEDDIAIVVVKTPLSVRPVCLDFDNNLDRTQLTEGNSGKIVILSDVPGWLDELDVFDIKYLKNEDCENLLTTYSRPYLTKDKFCAKFIGRFPRLEHIGSGLAFYDSTTQRYYLQGVHSIFYIGADQTYSNTMTTMVMLHTSITKHKDFIKQHL